MSTLSDKLDLILGIKKPQTPHNFQKDERVRTLSTQKKFAPGRTGTVTGFDEYNFVAVTLDILPSLSFYFHPTHIERTTQ